ncbi:MAG: PAS domain S-box protein [Chloroflexota bacterium]|nr:PAS domain S-box protein [Chloroflexota bacterium]
MLLAEQFVPNQARLVGVVLAELRYISAEAAGQTLEVLGTELVSDLPAEDLAALHSRLASVLGELTVGFCQQQHALIMADQETIHRIVVASQREAEEARRVSEARYQAILAHVREGVVVVDTHTNQILDANPAFHQMLGYGKEELCGVSLYDIVAHDRTSIDEGIRQTLHQGQCTVGERLCRRKDGTVTTVEATAATIATESATLLSVIVRDLTKQARTVLWHDSVMLTEREQLLLELLEQGWDDVHIAGKLGLSRQTVRNNLSHVYKRLGVSSRLEAVAWAREHGSVPRQPE